MEKIVLPNEVAQDFCVFYNSGDLEGLCVLKEANLKKCFLDWDTECLLEAVISMNNILNDYFWVNSLNDFNEETRPTFDSNWLSDLEDRYFNSKQKLIARFSNIGFNEDSGELEIKEGVENE